MAESITLDTLFIQMQNFFMGLFVPLLLMVNSNQAVVINDTDIPLSQSPFAIEQQVDDPLGVKIHLDEHYLVYTDDISKYTPVKILSDFKIYKSLNNQKIIVEYTGEKDRGVVVITNNNIKKTYSLNSQLEYIELLEGSNTIKLYKRNLPDSNKAKLIGTITLENTGSTYIGETYNVSTRRENIYEVIKISNEIWDKSDSIDDYIRKSFEYTSKIIYDYQLAEEVKAGNSDYKRSDIVETIEKQTGVCLDKSSLLVALLRVKGIEAKLSFGKIKNFDGYHVWIECYSPNYGWIIIDPTLRVYNMPRNMIEVVEYIE